jgi:hypothetical protein
MSGTGWELRPAGSLLLFILGVLLALATIQWLQKIPQKNLEDTLT